jgi:hypothetical protein
MIGAGYCRFTGLLPPATALEIFGPPDVIVGGTFRPDPKPERQLACGPSPACGRLLGAFTHRRPSFLRLSEQVTTGRKTRGEGSAEAEPS